MTVKDLHREAMKYVDFALIAKQEGKAIEVQSNYIKAFELEKLAFVLYSSTSSEEPTRSILLLSAANLALLADMHEEAEIMISLGIAGNPGFEIAEKFRELLQLVTIHRY